MRGTVLVVAAGLLLIGAPAAGQTVIEPASDDPVRAADDYATRAFQDPWDMSQKTDLGWFTYQPDSNLSAVSFQSGVFSAQSVNSDPFITVLDTGVPGTAFLGKIGANFPIDADTYRFVCSRMSLDSASYLQFFWSKNTIFNGQSSTNPHFFNDTGWQFLMLDIPSLGLNLSGAGSWSGFVDSLRFDPSGEANEDIMIDWLRLVELDASLNRTIEWTPSGVVDIYLDDDDNPTNGNLGLLKKAASGSSFTFNAGCLAPGTYYVAVTEDGGSSFAYSNGAYIVNDIPTLAFTSPSEEGSSDDYASTVLGNPWDMDTLSDVDLHFNITNLRITNVTAENEAGASLGSVRVLAGESVAASPGSVGDPQVFPLWSTVRGGANPIDSNRYRVLTLEMGVPGERDLVGGSVARVIWKVAGEPQTSQNVSEDVVVRSDGPGLVLNKIVADMKALPLEAGSPSQTGWNGFVDGFRVDPHEFSSPTSFAIRRVKLAAFEKAFPSYGVEWSYSDADPGGSLSLFYDSDRTGFNGTLIASGLDPTSGAYVWDTSALPSGDYFLYATFSDGVNSNRAYAPWPVRVGGLTVSVAASSGSFSTGNTLVASVNVGNEGSPGMADFYFGALLPDGDTIVYFTDLSFNTAVGSLSDLTTLSPIAAGVDLSGPFTVIDPSFFSYFWLGNEPPGLYTLFLAAARPGTFADGSLDPGDLLSLATVNFTFFP